MENKQRAMKMGIRANGNLGQHFQKQASKWDPICSRAYCMGAGELMESNGGDFKNGDEN